MCQLVVVDALFSLEVTVTADAVFAFCIQQINKMNNKDAHHSPTAYWVCSTPANNIVPVRMSVTDAYYR